MKKIIPLVLILLSAFQFIVFADGSNPVKEKYEQAMAAFMRKDYAQAIELFEVTLRLYPDFAQPYNFMAMAKKELGGSDDEVVELLKKSVAIDPGFALAHDNLGKMYYGMAKFTEAKEHAEKAIELAPDLLTARLSLAWICLLGLGETREAIEHFEIALAQQKTDYGQFGLGMAYFMDHQRGRVLEMITNLRVEGNEQLAVDLEEMIRNGRYLPPKGIQSLINPQPTTPPANVPAPETASAEKAMKYPVRLSGKLDESANAAPANTAPTAMTGAERIKQLQRNVPQPVPGY